MGSSVHSAPRHVPSHGPRASFLPMEPTAPLCQPVPLPSPRRGCAAGIIPRPLPASGSVHLETVVRVSVTKLWAERRLLVGIADSSQKFQWKTRKASAAQRWLLLCLPFSSFQFYNPGVREGVLASRGPSPQDAAVWGHSPTTHTQS